MSLDSLFWFLLLLECKLFNEIFLFFFLPPSHSKTSPNPPTSCSCFFSWTNFCQVIISHRLVEHSVISKACTSLLLFIQTRLKHLIFKSKSTDFFRHKPPVYGLLRAVMFIEYKPCLPSSLLFLQIWSLHYVPQLQTEVCGLMHAINMLHAVRSQMPDTELPFS